MTDYVTLLQRRLLFSVDQLCAAVKEAAARGYTTGYEDGYNAAIAEVKRTQAGLVRALDTAATRWQVRGQRRTRQTFADPHPGDYPGMLP